ncbi:hypothetical protein T458_05955 [Brevibacillus panacihumi W25]|uniref:SbsA Ig-like domain-containing protein n=1 Tax=Brevibacillus panacihumi W25 TaxID=1408254 RepID=V6MAR0_9BACL|nr:hypothetical protein T458_05955 [Brevibacillus panacihumi W25]
MLTWFIVSHLVLVFLTIRSLEGYDNYSDTGGTTPFALTDATVSVDNDELTASATPTAGQYGVTLDNGSDTLKAATKITIPGLTAGQHTISIVGAKDLAGNYFDYTTTVTVADDTTPPTVTSLTAEGEKIRVKFSEPLVDVDLTATTGGADTATRAALYNGTTYIDINDTDAVDEDGTEYLVDASSWIASSWASVNVVVKAGFKDASGNAMATDTTAKRLTLTSDATAPTVSSVNVEGADLVVKFSEPVVAGTSALTAAGATDLGFKYTNKDSVVVADTDGSYDAVNYGYDLNHDGDTTDADEDKYVVITLDDARFVTAGKLNAGSYEITLPDQAVKDKSNAANELEETVLTFTVSEQDQTDDTLTVAIAQLANNSEIEFDFNANVTNAALDRTKYTINGVELPEGTTFYFDGTKDKVVAVLPVGTIASNGNRTVAVVTAGI